MTCALKCLTSVAVSTTTTAKSFFNACSWELSDLKRRRIVKGSRQQDKKVIKAVFFCKTSLTLIALKPLFSRLDKSFLFSCQKRMLSSLYCSSWDQTVVFVVVVAKAASCDQTVCCCSCCCKGSFFSYT